MISNAVFSQSKKQVKEFKIKSTTTWNANNNSSGTANPVKDTYEEFDKSGRTTLFIEYKADGTIKYKKSVVYNSNGDEIEKCEYDATGLLKKTVTTYNANEDKQSETFTDGKGNIIKKCTFTYDTKGLRLTKQTYNASNILVSVKKYVYTYE